MTPRPLGRVLDAGAAGLYRDAASALLAARAEAAAHVGAVAEAAAAEAAELRRTVDAAARADAARLLADTAADARRELAVLRLDIAEAISAGVARVLGERPTPDAVARAAAAALAGLAERHGLVVRVHPDSAAAVRDALAPDIRVVADDALPPDDCIVETAAGFIRAGLADQLAHLRATLRAHALA